MFTRFVSQGQSFFQAFLSVQTAREVGCNPGLAGVTEGTVRRSVQFTIAIILQRVRDIITTKSTWAFIITFHGAANHEDSYLDVRLRAHVCGGIINFHLLAIPTKDCHTGAAMFGHVKDLLQLVIDDLCTTRLLFWQQMVP